MPGRYQFSLPERPTRDGWFRIGTVDVTTTALMVALGVLSMFWYAVDKASLVNLVFFGYDVRHGDVWRVITWPIVNPPDSIWVVLTLVFFWFVGHRIEDRVGRRRFTKLLLAMIVLPPVLVTFMGLTPTYATYGLVSLGLGLLVVFALDNPGLMFFFGIPGWVLAAVYVGIDVIRYTGDRAWEPLLLELCVIIVGLVGARQYGMVDNLSFIPQFGRGKQAKPAARKARHGTPSVVAGPWAGSEVAHSPADEIELNHLLDKINDVGIDALSRNEKARLNELSKKLRGR